MSNLRRQVVALNRLALLHAILRNNTQCSPPNPYLLVSYLTLRTICMLLKRPITIPTRRQWCQCSLGFHSLELQSPYHMLIPLFPELFQPSFNLYHRLLLSQEHGGVQFVLIWARTVTGVLGVIIGRIVLPMKNGRLVKEKMLRIVSKTRFAYVKINPIHENKKTDVSRWRPKASEHRPSNAKKKLPRNRTRGVRDSNIHFNH